MWCRWSAARLRRSHDAARFPLETHLMSVRKGRSLAWLAAGLGCLIGLGAVAQSPATRTSSYFWLQRVSSRQWPELGNWIAGRLAPLAQPFAPVWVRVEPRVTMWLDPADYVSRAILESGAWEPESWGGIERRLRDGATFVDVGAHIGYFSLKAAKAVGPGGRVIAVEPNPETVAKLQGNVRASGANVVTVQPVACSDSEATLDFFAADTLNTGQSSLSAANASQAGQARSYRVRARPLDAILQEAGVSRVDVIKIDVEGAELMVLRGARETLARHRPVVVLELEDSLLRQMGASVSEVTAFLNAQGYAAARAYTDEGNTEFVPTR
jgi:FkbM family methyltransferase